MTQPLKEKSRRLHLGIDYGTAWSKLVLRDMEAPKGEPESFVLTPVARPESHLFPSLVSLSDGRLHFAWNAEEVRATPGPPVFASIKMRMVDDVLRGFHAPAEQLPDGLDEEDLACLTVVYLMQEGIVAARAYAAKRGAQVKLSTTLGVPMTPRCYPEIQAVFSRVAYRAFTILREGWAARTWEMGIPLDYARDLMDLSRRNLPGDLDPNQWVRSEAGAALHWAMSSPKVEEGLYAAVDIGAGTTSTSVFNILATPNHDARTWTKTAIAVFGASCGAPAMDWIDEILASGVPGRKGTELRGKEGQYSAKIEHGKEFLDVLKQMNENRRAAFRQAYASHRRQSAWETRKFKGIFLFGGGHRVDSLRKLSRQYVWRFSRDPFPERRLEWPGDLVGGLELNGNRRRVEPPFASDLLVAYGLSFPFAGTFPVDNPESIEPVPVARLYENPTWRDRDDLYAR